jgi:oleate hydratase
MRNYYLVNTQPPAGIDKKNAHIVGGGIAGLAAAVFLVDDAHMPGTGSASTSSSPSPVER